MVGHADCFRAASELLTKYRTETLRRLEEAKTAAVKRYPSSEVMPARPPALHASILLVPAVSEFQPTTNCIGNRPLLHLQRISSKISPKG